MNVGIVVPEGTVDAGEMQKFKHKKSAKERAKPESLPSENDGKRRGEDSATERAEHDGKGRKPIRVEESGSNETKRGNWKLQSSHRYVDEFISKLHCASELVAMRIYPNIKVRI